MNDIEKLHEMVRAALPQAVTDYGPPALPTGNHNLHVQVDGRWFHVLWRHDTKFWIGYLDPDDTDVGLFDIMAPDAVNVTTVDEAAKTLLALIVSRQPVAAAR